MYPLVDDQATFKMRTQYFPAKIFIRFLYQKMERRI
jgi:hypothetical protein